MSDGDRDRSLDLLPLGIGVAASVAGYALVATVTGLDASADLSTVLRPGALGLYPGAVLAGYLGDGGPRIGADLGFRTVFVATTIAQGALFLGHAAPAHFLLLGLMGAALSYALVGVPAGAVGGVLGRLAADTGFESF
ncbi:hypothetical protein BRC83_00200 [Halobacteriales archaeon QS_1_68_17]|nr:MAG: hypothetical protein BRC83_00200 [Halobacteriales archaeon QS_1_68_17]